MTQSAQLKLLKNSSVLMSHHTLQLLGGQPTVWKLYRQGVDGADYLAYGNTHSTSSMKAANFCC